MTGQPPYSFFVLRDDGQNQTVQRITVTQQLQQQMTNLFAEQRGDLLTAEADEIVFSGETLNADPGEILVIPDFPVPAIITNVANNPNAATPLVFTTAAAYQIRSIFAVVPTNPAEILFQAFDRRRVLAEQASRFAIYHSEGTFQRLDSPAIILDSRLSAVQRNGTLYFRSYQVAKRIFDLTPYYREASNEEITSFLHEGFVGCDAPADLLQNIDTIGRKKLTLVRSSGVLGKVPVKTLVRIAKKHKITITTEQVNGTQRIVFPAGRKELKAVLSFLNQDIYEAPLTKDGRFLSRSKTPMKD